MCVHLDNYTYNKIFMSSEQGLMIFLPIYIVENNNVYSVCENFYLNKSDTQFH